MYCANCGKEIENNAAFCPFCGEKQNNYIDNNENDNEEWFYIRDNSRQGPYNINSIILEINNGSIKRDTLVWKKGMQKWLFAEMTALSQNLSKVVPSIPDEVVDNKYVWALATVPILISWLVESMLAIPTLITIVTIGLNIVFISLDVSLLKKAGKDASSWLWLGIVLVPLYLFMRAAKTDKKYLYGITWCVIFAIDLLL